MGGGGTAPRRWRRALHGVVPLLPLLARQAERKRFVVGMRPCLFGDAVDAHRVRRPRRTVLPVLTARAVLTAWTALTGRTAPAGRTALVPGSGPVRAGRNPALDRQLPCAAFFVPHRPVPVPHAGPGPAPRCL